LSAECFFDLNLEESDIEGDLTYNQQLKILSSARIIPWLLFYSETLIVMSLAIVIIKHKISYSNNDTYDDKDE
jgi:hypothetical protein